MSNKLKAILFFAALLAIASATAFQINQPAASGGGGGNRLIASTVQALQSPVTGTGAVANVFQASIPANTVPVAGMLDCVAFFQHTTGTASVSYAWNVGGSGSPVTGGVNTTTNSSTSTAQSTAKLRVILNSGSHVAGTFFGYGWQFGASGAAPARATFASNDFSQPVNITLTFNVAATDAVTPQYFWCEVVQP